MDPLSALGVAAAGVQFIDFTTRLLSNTIETYKSASGTTDKITSLENIATELTTLTTRVQEKAAQLPQSPAPESPDGLFLDACRQCQGISMQLAAVLQPLAVRRPSKFKRKSLRSALSVALRGAMSEKKIEELSAQLQMIQQRMQLAALVSLWEKAQRDGTPITEVFQRQLSTIDNTATEIAYLRDLAVPGDNNSRDIFAHNKMVEVIWSTAWAPTVPANTNTAFADVAQSHILHSLSYDSIRYREEAIPEAFAVTFEWLFNPHSGQGAAYGVGKGEGQDVKQPNYPAPWSSFTSWLEADTRDIYWITGKPGSGKSTLIKFLANHPRLKEHLATWAGSTPVIIASFYSWNAGADLQRCFEGLLRSLLFQCLQQKPELTAQVCPRRWACFQLLGRETVRGLPAWGTRELTEVFKSLISLAGEAFRVALLIDGLDEFETDHGKLVEFIVGLSHNDAVKICTSSRPWNVFNDAFHRNPSLRVQELTKGDIFTYVTGHFEPLPAYAELQSLDPKGATALVNEIAARADGVFLWVSIVVRTVTAQLSDGASLTELYASVNQLPRDIERLFDAIKAQIKPVLLLMEFYRSPCYEGPAPATFLLAAETEDSWAHREFRATGEVPAALSAMRRLLQSRTMGMIEFTRRAGVCFLHRTVADWATRKQSLEALVRDASSPDGPFNPSLELVKGRAAELIRGRFGPSHDPDYPLRANSFWSTVAGCLCRAAWAAGHREADNARLLGILDRLETYLHPILQADLPPDNTPGSQCIMQHPFACLAAAFCISPHVMAKARNPGLCGSLLRLVVLGGVGEAWNPVGWGPLEPLREHMGRYAPRLHKTRIELVSRLLWPMPQTPEKREVLKGIVVDLKRIRAARSYRGESFSGDFSSAVLAILTQELGTRTWLWRFIVKGPQRGHRGGQILQDEDPTRWREELKVIGAGEIDTMS